MELHWDVRYGASWKPLFASCNFFFLFHNLTKEYPLNIILSIKRILLTFTEKMDDFYNIYTVLHAQIDAVITRDLQRVQMTWRAENFDDHMRSYVYYVIKTCENFFINSRNVIKRGFLRVSLSRVISQSLTILPDKRKRGSVHFVNSRSQRCTHTYIMMYHSHVRFCSKVQEVSQFYVTTFSHNCPLWVYVKFCVSTFEFKLLTPWVAWNTLTTVLFHTRSEFLVNCHDVMFVKQYGYDRKSCL